MKRAATDAQFSIESGEFVWAQEGLSEIHACLLPVIWPWLLQAKAKKVLDLGCGNAALTCELSKQGFEMTGLDSSASGIAIGRKSYPQLELIHADLERGLPENFRGRFDAVLAVEVVEHLLLPRCLFARAKEGLKKGGIFILSTPYHGFLKNLALALANKFDNHWHPLRDYGHVKFFSRNTIGRLFVEQGFVVDKFKRVGRCPPLAKTMIVQGKLLQEN